MENIQQFLPLILVVVVMYFLMIRPQQKKQKQINEMRKNIKRGDKVQSAGGLVGRVIKVKDDVVTIECGSDKVRLELAKGALTVLEATPESGKKEKQPVDTYEYDEDGQDEVYEEYDVSDDDYMDGGEDYTDEFDGGNDDLK